MIINLGGISSSLNLFYSILVVEISILEKRIVVFFVFLVVAYNLETVKDEEMSPTDPMRQYPLTISGSFKVYNPINIKPRKKRNIPQAIMVNEGVLQ